MGRRTWGSLAAGLALSVAMSAEAGSPPVAAPGEVHRLMVQTRAERLSRLGPLSPPIPGQERVDVLHYGLDLSIDPVAESMTGSVEIRLRAEQAGTDSLFLDFTSRSQMHVDSVQVDGTNAPFTWAEDCLAVSLGRALSVSEEATARVWYGGEPETGREGFRFRYTPRGQRIIWTLSEPQMARSWWPCKDVPSDKATARVSVRVPVGMTAVSNGTCTGVVDHGDGTATWTWEETYTIATYLVSLSVSEYDFFQDWYRPSGTDSMPVVYYVYPADREEAEEDFRDTVEMIEFYASVFGEYPFLREKYGMVEVPWGGAMEHQTLTSYGDMLITGAHVFDSVIAHELSHQWWGDAVSPDTWDEVWLNEGFATYCEALWIEHREGRSAYFDYMESLDRRSEFVGSLYAPSSDPDSAFSYPYVYTVYDKGAWVLHMLRFVMGDSVFFDLLAQEAEGYGTTTTERLLERARDLHGDSMDEFFDQWVYGTGRPEYEYRWDAEPLGDGYRLAMDLDQVQSCREVFTMPLELGVETTMGDTLLRMVDSLRTQRLEVDLGGLPLRVEIDPSGWVLKRVNEPTLSLAFRPAYPNPFRVETNLVFDLPRAADVDLSVYDVLGRRVRQLVDGGLETGRNRVTWAGTDARGEKVAPGVYFCRMATAGRSMTQRVVVLR